MILGVIQRRRFTTFGTWSRQRMTSTPYSNIPHTLYPPRRLIYSDRPHPLATLTLLYKVEFAIFNCSSWSPIVHRNELIRTCQRSSGLATSLCLRHEYASLGAFNAMSSCWRDRIFPLEVGTLIRNGFLAITTKYFSSPAAILGPNHDEQSRRLVAFMISSPHRSSYPPAPKPWSGRLVSP